MAVCQTVHGAIAAYHLDNNEQLVLDVKKSPADAAVSEKLKALLSIAGKVQHGGKRVQPQDIKKAKKLGATDLEIHDTG